MYDFSPSHDVIFVIRETSTKHFLDFRNYAIINNDIIISLIIIAKYRICV